MSKEPPPSLQALWQGQPVDPKRFSPEEIRAKATRFQRKVRGRNLREYVGACLVIVIFSVYAWEANTWQSMVGPVLIVVGTLYLVLYLYTRGGSQPVPGGEGNAGVTESCLRFHRRELERQRDLLRTVGRWYLGPLIPGVVVSHIVPLVDVWARGGDAIAAVLRSAVLSALVFGGVWWLNAVGAKKLQREIDALEREPTGERA